MSDITAPNTEVLAVGATRFASVDFHGQLDQGELLTGTPTVEDTAGVLTITNAKVSTEGLTINGSDAAPGEAVQFTVTGGVSGTTYSIKVTVSTDAGQTLVGYVQVKAE